MNFFLFVSLDVKSMQMSIVAPIHISFYLNTVLQFTAIRDEERQESKSKHSLFYYFFKVTNR